MSERGVFAVDRGIWEDPDFSNEPFTEREAFLWLVSEAAWKPCRRRAGSKVVELDRGQVCHSVRFMAQAWQWSKSRVDRFLDRLENRDTIKRVTGTEPIVISICKYDAFQRVGLPERDTSGTQTGTAAGHERDRLENIENIESISSSLHSEDCSVAERPEPKPRKHSWPADYEDRIWRLYPKGADKKVSLERLRALFRSDKLPYEVLVAGIERLISHISDPKFAPTLDRFIRQEKWNDEYRTGPPGRAPPRGGNPFAELAFQYGEQMKEERYERAYDDIEIIPPGRS